MTASLVLHLDEHLKQALIERATAATASLRRRNMDIASSLSRAIYQTGTHPIPAQTIALAKVFWPLICTTNYDYLYIAAKCDEWQRCPDVYGRSIGDCHGVLKHLAFPSREIVWALQGLVPRRYSCIDKRITSRLEKELVVGHREYRAAANNAPHFRRCFAELFRSRSFLFLGSGLAEQYFRTLFDEIIELTGIPPRPHFALVSDKSGINTEFMKEQYNIVCFTYESKNNHKDLSDKINDISRSICEKQRTIQSRWGFRDLPVGKSRITNYSHCDKFTCVIGVLPLFEELKENQVLVVSFGINRVKRPIFGDGLNIIGNIHGNDFELIKGCEYTFSALSSPLKNRVFAIGAREPNSHDAKNLAVIGKALKEFLEIVVSECKTITVHMQILASGKNSEEGLFQHWASLVQMTRSYGEWLRKDKNYCKVNLTIYIVDPGTRALLHGGYMNLSQELRGDPIQIYIEVIDSFGDMQRYVEIAPSNKLIKDVLTNFMYTKSNQAMSRMAKIRIWPNPRHTRSGKQNLKDVEDYSLNALGLVTGSTLEIDYRKTPWNGRFLARSTYP